METGQLSTEEILSAVTTLSTPDLEQVFHRVLTVQAERKAPHLASREASLLERINQGTPTPLRERFDLLKAKRADSSISDAEYAELTALSHQVEELHAERMTALVELAKWRGITLPTLMNQLGIHFPEYV